MSGRASRRSSCASALFCQIALGVAMIPGLFLITQQFPLRVPDLQAMPVDYVMIWTQGLGGFERRFQGLKRLHGMTAVSRDAKRSV